MAKLHLLLALGLASTLLITPNAELCGIQAGSALCPGGLCCSCNGWCGNTSAHCDQAQGCQSQCWTPSPPRDVASILTRSLFDQLLKHRNDAMCPASNFYTYEAFVTAADAFAGFGTTGDLDTRKREIAAFLAQTSHQTTAGWADAPDGPYAWGYCFKEDLDKADHCVHSPEWPCVPDKSYHGRGPMQIEYNYNYGPAGQVIGVDLLSNPDLVATDPVISFKTAIWFWMTSQYPKPSCHDVITGAWTPSPVDQVEERVPGYGLITNIINGKLECGHGPNARVLDRMGFFWRYCTILGVSPGDNLDCYNQSPFGWTVQAAF